MGKAQRRYFVEVDNGLQDLRDEVLGKAKEQKKQRAEIQARYGAASASTYRDGRIANLAFLFDPDEKAKAPPGFLLLHKEGVDGQTYSICKPDKRTIIGRNAAKDIVSMNKFSGMDFIVEYFKASRWVPQQDGGSSTGMSVAISTAGIIKGKVVLSVPVDEREPFETPEGLLEIKKSEFIALTEES